MIICQILILTLIILLYFVEILRHNQEHRLKTTGELEWGDKDCIITMLHHRTLQLNEAEPLSNPLER